MNRNRSEDKNIQIIRKLIWLYFWLLIFEGALRKWALPQLSNPLLIVRDPVVLLAYAFAWRAGVFPKNGWVLSIGIIGFLAFLVSYVPLWQYVAPLKISLLAGFGFRANFLHLPFIFVVASVMRWEDVKQLGWWSLILMGPMALLMVAQFEAAPDAYLNRTAGGEGEMMTSALGRVRTAGTFSFVIGIVMFFSLASAYLIWAALRRDVYPNWILFCAGAALLIGTVVSGSRSVVMSCLVVAASLVIIVFLRPAALNRFGQTLLVAAIGGLILMKTPIFKEGFTVLSTRFNDVAEITDRSVGLGLIERVGEQFSDSYFSLKRAPLFGYGLGVGTNAGAKFLTGSAEFLLAEDEWSRIFLESGPLVGLAFVIWRCGIVWSVGVRCVRVVKEGNLLPLLLFSSSCLPLLFGQFGQPTILGFAVLVTGLALAALKETELEIATEPLVSPSGARRLSPYARRLHGHSEQPGHTNGSVDR